MPAGNEVDGSVTDTQPAAWPAATVTVDPLTTRFAGADPDEV